jgi:hypothetical protein
MASMNTGKACAQSAHAANYFAWTMNNRKRDFCTKAGEFHSFEDMEKAKTGPASLVHYQRWVHNIRLFNQWETSTPQGFGVTICLDVDEHSLPLVVDAASAMGFPAGVAHDPSYPLMDGQVLHLLPLDTCGFVFGEKPKLEALLGHFNLLA